MVKHPVKLLSRRKSNKADDRLTVLEVMSFLVICKSCNLPTRPVGICCKGLRGPAHFSQGTKLNGAPGTPGPLLCHNREAASAPCQWLYLPTLSYGNYLRGKRCPHCSPLVMFPAHQQHGWSPLSRRQEEVLLWEYWVAGLVRKCKD